ncbi:MAG: Fe-S cluster assembly protein SufD [Candidatus Dormibacteria bacterium]
MTELAQTEALGRETAPLLELDGGDLAFVRRLRESAQAAYREAPWPSSSRDEDWRRTPQVDKLDPALYSLGASSGPRVGDQLRQLLDEPMAGLFTGRTLVTDQSGNLELGEAADGCAAVPLRVGLSEDPGAWEQVLGRIANPGLRKFVSLNTALMRGGAAVRVGPGSAAEPVRLINFVDRGSASFPRTVILVEEGASLTLVEQWASPDEDETLLAPVVEVLLGPGARLTHVVEQRCGNKTVVQSTVRVRLSRDAHYDLRWVMLGGRWQKSYFDVEMLGEGSESKATGLCIGRRDQHFDIQTLQDHVARGAISDLLYRVALAERSRSVFAGLIRVEEGAQKTNAYVQNRNLLLSPQAKADSNPTLEILANDVRCTHGSTAGRIDDNQLFYCESRGIPREQARRLVVEGFFADVVDSFPEGSIRESADAAVQTALEELTESGALAAGRGSG